MKRCTPGLAFSPKAALTMALCLGVVSLAAHAQSQTGAVKLSVREFPKAALRGEMVVQNHPEIVLNGQAERLSPGARIWSATGMLVLSAQLHGQVVTVNYMRENSGLVHQVWVLNSEELKERRAGGNVTIFNFSTGDTPAKP